MQAVGSTFYGVIFYSKLCYRDRRTCVQSWWCCTCGVQFVHFAYDCGCRSNV